MDSVWSQICGLEGPIINLETLWRHTVRPRLAVSGGDVGPESLGAISPRHRILRAAASSAPRGMHHGVRILAVSSGRMSSYGQPAGAWLVWGYWRSPDHNSMAVQQFCILIIFVILHERCWFSYNIGAVGQHAGYGGRPTRARTIHGSSGNRFLYPLRVRSDGASCRGK